jgi:uncharacterized protein involved in exopolysaccharide biosynthesis
MEEAFDLRQLLQALLRNKVLILLLTLAAGVAGFIAGSLATPVYRATALVSLAELPYTLRLEQVNQQTALPADTYPALAISDAVLSDLLLAARDVLPAHVTTVSQLRGRLEAQTASDPALLRLTAGAEDPQTAMTLANTWASLVAERAAALYGPDTGQLAMYQEQLTLARQALEQAEQAVAAFESENQVTLLTAQLRSQEDSLTDYLNRQHRYQMLILDAQDLLNRLEQQDGGAAASPFDEAAFLVLVAQGSSNLGTSAASIQVEIVTGGSPSSQTVSQLSALVRTFITDLRARAADAATQAEMLGPALLALQGRLAVASQLQTELRRESSLAETEYLSLAAKVEQARIAAQDAVSNVRIASHAALPAEPSGVGRATLALLAAALGFLTGVVGALLWEWWQSPRVQAREAPVDHKAEHVPVA